VQEASQKQKTKDPEAKKELYRPAASLRILDDEFGWLRDAKASRRRTLLAIKLYLNKPKMSGQHFKYARISTYSLN
jgi:hypothetical protein